jgi:hypothetical protein
MTLIALMMLAADPMAELPEVVLLDFTASYCGPCKEMVPTIQAMEKAGFPIRKVDITAHPNISRQFQVEKIPTFIVLVNGQEKNRLVGRRSGDELQNMMIEARDELREQRRPPQEANAPKPDVRVASAKEQPGGLGGLFDRIRKGLGGRRQNEGFQYPTYTVRGQSPEPQPREAAGDIAMAATVRVRVTKPGNKEDVGTGSVVHSTAATSTILTCAHLFHDSVRGSTVEIEVFRDGKTLKYPARVLGANEKSDLAILQIQNNTLLPTVEIASLDTSVASGDSAFSIGCSNGELPTPLSIEVVDIDRYKGPSNIVCTVDPAVGRSGGGLFNSNGQLIGVCSCADRDQHEGLYMARQPIVELFKNAKLTHLLTRTDDSASPPEFAGTDKADGNSFDEMFADVEAEPDMDNDSEMTSLLRDLEESPVAQSEERDALTRVASRDQAASMNSSPVEITVIVDSGNSSQPKDMIVIQRPSPWLLELLTGESSGTQQLTAARKVKLTRTSAPQLPRASKRNSAAASERRVTEPSVGRSRNSSGRRRFSAVRTRTAGSSL